jgi:mannose-6-phosphate isomerase-like protein (cupin superfamily)
VGYSEGRRDQEVAVAIATFWKATDSADLRHQEAIHDGVGTIVRRMFSREQSRLPVRFDVWELPPGASEGDHTHGGNGEGRALEEMHYFLGGHGSMRIDGEEVAVAPGDAIMVPPGVDHGLYNTGTEPPPLVLLWGEPKAPG